MRHKDILQFVRWAGECVCVCGKEGEGERRRQLLVMSFGSLYMHRFLTLFFPKVDGLSFYGLKIWSQPQPSAEVVTFWLWTGLY